MVVDEDSTGAGRLVTSDPSLPAAATAGFGFSWLAKRLYGYRAINDTVGSNDISASQGHRRYNIVPRLYQVRSKNAGSAGDPNKALYSDHTFQFSTFPSFADSKVASYDLRTYRDVVAHIEFEPKPGQGLLGFHSSILMAPSVPNHGSHTFRPVTLKSAPNGQFVGDAPSDHAFVPDATIFNYATNFREVS